MRIAPVRPLFLIELDPKESLDPHVYSSIEQVKEKYTNDVNMIHKQNQIFNPVFVLEDKNEE